jgi:DNA-3-methyladenine glycosylase I
MTTRCFWANTDDPLYLSYHDLEWGVPIHDEKVLFEFLILEGVQAGLNWYTVLRKRPNYHMAFDDFDPHKIAQYDEKKVSELLENPGIIRNRLKVNAAIQNARSFLLIQQEFGSFDSYLWQFVDGKPRNNAWKTGHEIPAQTEVSQQMSKDLLKRGFRFVGPTICYAYMQAVGLVNDHTTDCFRYQEILSMHGN